MIRWLKISLGVASCVLSTLVLSGCGGGSGGMGSSFVPAPAAANKTADGTVSLSVTFPTAKAKNASFHAAAIPETTNRIVVRLRPAAVAGFPLAKPVSILIEKPAVGTPSVGTSAKIDATISGLFPLLTYAVDVEARRVAAVGTGTVSNPTATQLTEGQVLATGSQNVIPRKGTVSPVSVVLNGNVAPVVNPPFITGGSVSTDPTDPTTIVVALNAVVNQKDGKPLTGLKAANFQVTEDAVNKTVVSAQETGSGTTTSRADIAFVIDTTSSMGEEIDGIQRSVQQFAEFIASKRVDVRLAGVTFGDAVREKFAFTNSYASFSSWVGNLGVDGGGRGPENAIEAIVTASNDLSWRAGAQRLIVVITDAPTHVPGDGDAEATVNFTPDQVVASLKSRGYALYSVSPQETGSARTAANSSLNFPPNSSSSHANRQSQAIPNPDVSVMTRGTGGAAYLMPEDGNVDLTKLPLTQIVLSGYTVKFKSVPTNSNHKIRLLVQNGGAYVADFNFQGRY